MPKRKTIQIVVTNFCGLGCSYCFEAARQTEEMMSKETAKKILDYELNLEDDYPEVVIDCFGGEPTRNWELIEWMYDYVSSRNWKKKWIFFMTTNGTLVHGKIKEWLWEHRDHFWVALSIDGTPQMHNRTRNKSFEKIEVPFFGKAWPEQPVKMTIAPSNLGNLAEGIIYLVEQYGFKVMATLAQGIEWDVKKQTPILKEQLELLTRYYIEHPKLELPRFLQFSLSKFLLSYEKEERWCGCGEGHVSYYVNGKEYPCQCFGPLAGAAKNEIFRTHDFKVTPINTNSECYKCRMKNVCPTCYGLNYLIRGEMSERDTSLCIFQQECLRASAIIQGQRIVNRKEKELSYDDICILKAVLLLDEIKGNLKYAG